MGRVLRTTLPTAQGGVVHLFVVYGYQGAEEDAEKLRLTDHLLQAVLVEAQMVCIGQPVLIAGDLNADPAVIPCLAKGISAGRHVDLALAFSLGAGIAPDVTCRFRREEGTGSRRDFFVGCPGALAASQACYVTDRWFTPHFSVIARFRIDAWMADVACPIACQPIWPACWLDTPDRSSSSSTSSVQDVWDVHRDELGEIPDDVVLALRDAVSRSAVDDFWSIWSKNAEAGLFRGYALAGGPTAAGSSAFLGRGLLRIRNRRLGGRAVGGLVGVMRLMCIVLSTLLTLLSLLLYSFVDASSLLRMFSKVLGVRVLLSLCGMIPRVMKLINTVLSFLSALLFLLFYSFVGVLNLLLMFLRVFGVKGSYSHVGML